MMSVILIASIALCLSCSALFNNSAKEKVPETPVGLRLIAFLAHLLVRFIESIGLCCNSYQKKLSTIIEIEMLSASSM